MFFCNCDIQSLVQYRSVFYKSCSTDIDSCLDDLYKYEYDVITVMESEIDYVNSIIKK